MSDLKKYVVERKRRDREFTAGFDEGHAQFKIGATLRPDREHAEDIKLSTLEKVAAALGKRLQVKIA